MHLLYNILLFLTAFLLSPFLVVTILASPKYRGRMARRLGAGLDVLLRHGKSTGPRIWVHALSVGEVASCRSLVEAVRSAFPEAMILFSAATRTGEEAALRTLNGTVDLFVPFPFDFPWSVRRVIRAIRPDLFILVETDFWPNFLQTLRGYNTPSILVNGRISKRSHLRYKRLRPFFLPMFLSFRTLTMQTDSDVLKMRDLGVPEEKLLKLGNLKYGLSLPEARESVTAAGGFGIPPGKRLWVAGSTHEGEEEIILAVHKRLLQALPDLFLVVAPRHPERAEKVKALAESTGLAAFRRTGPVADGASVMVLDTIGELRTVYAQSEVVFIGGSLVGEGGHNPLEPAFFGKPVLFGPHMEDFEEISKDLVQAEGGETVRNEEELFESLQSLLVDSPSREHKGGKAAALVKSHSSVVARHVELIRGILTQSGHIGK